MKVSQVEESEPKLEDGAAHGHPVQHEDPSLMKDMEAVGAAQGIVRLGKSFHLGIIAFFFVCVLSAPCFDKSINYGPYWCWKREVGKTLSRH